MNTIIRDPKLLFAPATVQVDHRADGGRVLRSPMALGPVPAKLGEHLERWAAEVPERTFLAERGADGEWVRLSYAETLTRVRAVGTWLLGQNLSVNRPVVVLSDNSIEHAILMLAAMHVGVPVSAISQAYSLVSKDFAKLKSNISHITPGVIFVEHHARFAPALAAIAPLCSPWLPDLYLALHRRRHEIAVGLLHEDLDRTGRALPLPPISSSTALPSPPVPARLPAATASPLTRK